MPFFDVALNLPHAARVARRMLPHLPQGPSGMAYDALAARKTVEQMVVLLDACFDNDENPPGAEGYALRDRAADLGRKLVEHIERGKFGGDRLGQCVRNFFECLELGREGAAISLRAGEDPKSMQRPC